MARYNSQVTTRLAVPGLAVALTALVTPAALAGTAPKVSWTAPAASWTAPALARTAPALTGAVVVVAPAPALAAPAPARTAPPISGTPPVATSGTGAHVIWLSANSSVGNLASVSRYLAGKDFGARGTLIQATAMITKNPVPSGYRSLPTGRWTSEARFAGAAAAGRIPHYIRVAHYDNEAWGETPVAEQHHPALYERKFCQVAHAHGLLCVTSPGRDLCAVAFPNSGSLNHCYLIHNMAGAAARYADFIDIQGEVNELHGTAVYKAFITKAASQAKAANPHVIALGNLAADPYNGTVSAAAMNADARAVFGTGTGQVAGFFITITNSGASTTARFLRLFEP